jgi:lysosomal acid lipase/cholesteryl ester hydrolase
VAIHHLYLLAFLRLILDPPIFVRLIDISCNFLFGWTGQNIAFQQKIVSYAHLYSYTSVKTLVHWFQIIRAQTFQMYDDETSTTIFGDTGAFYKVAKFPTKNIHSPIVLIYGGIDSLVEYFFCQMSLT